MRPFGCPAALERYRVLLPHYPRGDARNGALFINPKGLRVIFSDGGGWEHVSVSRMRRAPSWEDMCWIKTAFWDKEATVLQFHPPESEYVNEHPHCLHLWRPLAYEVPLPPSIMVGWRKCSSDVGKLQAAAEARRRVLERNP